VDARDKRGITVRGLSPSSWPGLAPGHPRLVESKPDNVDSRHETGMTAHQDVDARHKTVPDASRSARPVIEKRRMHPFKAIGLKLISALLFAVMSALVRKLGDVAPVGQMVFSAAPSRFFR